MNKMANVRSVSQAVASTPIPNKKYGIPKLRSTVAKAANPPNSKVASSRLMGAYLAKYPRLASSSRLV